MVWKIIANRDRLQTEKLRTSYTCGSKKCCSVQDKTVVTNGVIMRLMD